MGKEQNAGGEEAPQLEEDSRCREDKG